MLIMKELKPLLTNISYIPFNYKKKVNLLDLNRNKLHQFFCNIGEKGFVADQVMQWIYHYYCDDFNHMTNLKRSLRDKLQKLAEIRAPEIFIERQSIDKTIKWILSINNQHIEMVCIPEHKRSTLCISSQIGCPLQCTFCYTGQQGFNRNLYVSEIVGQIWRANKMVNIDKKYNIHPITNIVLMGMGEPLLNLTNVIPSIEIMLDNFGFGFSKRHITISTVGIPKALDSLKDKIDVLLAISLHAPNDTIRNKIMPINKKYNISSVLSAACRFLEKSYANHGKITIEYILLRNINDQIDHAYQLVQCLKNVPCKINLIPWNAFQGSIYQRSTTKCIKNFLKILIHSKITTIIRKTRGYDINASCGQLSGKVCNRINNSKYTT